MHPVFDLNAHFVEFLFVRAKDHHIIHISDVIRRPKLLFNVKIQWCKIEIRKTLA